MIPYTPSRFEKPAVLLDVPSAWKGLEWIIKDIIETFGLKGEKALEFGVEFGYSITALANYFKEVIGVDTFKGDANTELHDIPGLYEAVQEAVPQNVKLIKSDYRDYNDDVFYDLIHIDIVHNYVDTFKCGDWAMKHSDVVLFHDTVSFPEVYQAVYDLAKKYDAVFYNYPQFNGLGILWKD